MSPKVCVAVQIKATDQYLLCYCLLCTIVYKVVLTFESKVKILKFGHSNKSYGAVVSCSAFFMLYKVAL